MVNRKKVKEEINVKVPVIRIPTRKNILLDQALERILQNVEILTLWEIGNVHAIDRLGMSDHGPVHFQIVSNSGLRLLRILHKRNIETSVTKNFGLDYTYSELIVVLSCLFHDLGMTIHRSEHETYSLMLANPLLHTLLDFLPIKERTIVISEVLHAIISHRRAGNPYTIEASIVRIADALDMSQGRSRIPYESGQVNIHSLSAYAIDNVIIEEGKDIPIEITILMSNSSGIFQIDELLKEKLSRTMISQYIHIKALVSGKTEKKLLSEFHIYPKSQ